MTRCSSGRKRNGAKLYQRVSMMSRKKKKQSSGARQLISELLVRSVECGFLFLLSNIIHSAKDPHYSLLPLCSLRQFSKQKSKHQKDDFRIKLFSRSSFPSHSGLLLYYSTSMETFLKSKQHHAALYPCSLNPLLTSTSPVYTLQFLSTSYDCISCKNSRPHSSCQI